MLVEFLKNCASFNDQPLLHGNLSSNVVLRAGQIFECTEGSLDDGAILKKKQEKFRSGSLIILFKL
jgi:hypothetical protein